MPRTFVKPILWAAVSLLLVPWVAAQWKLPSGFSKPEILEISQEVLARPDIPINVKEDIFRMSVLGMEWDVGGAIYEPTDPSRIPLGADGKKAGIFMIHGGGGDYRSKDSVSRLLAGKFGFKVYSMSYPGTIYLLDPSRDWPGDLVKEDGSVRTPIWNKDKLITRDQYDVVEDRSMRPKYGTITNACAKEGTEFYNRLAAHPMAFEEAGKEMMRRHFPVEEYSIYIHGHSTGGPYSFMFTQRVENIAGLIGMETSPYGSIYRLQSKRSGNPYGKTPGEVPFSCMTLFDWRLTAMYLGDEALMLEGPEALMRLPMLMEEVYEAYEKSKNKPRFKTEGPVHFGGIRELARAAKATAQRLDMGEERTQQLIDHYVGYARELRGPDVKPVPPVILGMTSASTSHTFENYKAITLPTFAQMDPPPKVSLVPFEAGVHGYSKAQEDLPMGVFPATALMWYEAIVNGYYTDNTPFF